MNKLKEQLNKEIFVYVTSLIIVLSVMFAVMIYFIRPKEEEYPPFYIENIGYTNFVPGAYAAYDQTVLGGNVAAEAKGSHIYITWRDIEGAGQGIFTWTKLDQYIAASDKTTIVRVLLRGPDAAGGYDEAVPAWALNYNPIVVTVPTGCSAPSERLNFIDPTVKSAILNMVSRLGARYKSNPKVSLFEIAAGYAGEPIPYPATSIYCDSDAQKTAYQAAYTTSQWGNFVIDLTTAYSDAFDGGTVPLTLMLSASYAEEYHDDEVRNAVSNGVGLQLTDLKSDYYSNRGSGGGFCYWGYITDPAFTNNSANAEGAFMTTWAALKANRSVITGYEFTNRFDPGGRIVSDTYAFTKWSMLNALSKGADYILAYNAGGGYPSQIEYDDIWSFFNTYAGKDSGTANSVFIYFHAPWTGYSLWCPDIFDYSYYLYSEMETIPYYTSAGQSTVQTINDATDIFDVGPSSDWRYYYARTTDDTWPEFNLDVDDNWNLWNGADLVNIEVTYFDHANGGTWSLYYASTSGEKLAGTITLTGTNTWKTFSYSAYDMQFDNSLTKYSSDSARTGFDIRLDRDDSINDIFSSVKINVSGSAPTATPTPSGSIPTSTPTVTGTPPTPTPTPLSTPSSWDFYTSNEDTPDGDWPIRQISQSTTSYSLTTSITHTVGTTSYFYNDCHAANSTCSITNVWAPGTESDQYFEGDMQFDILPQATYQRFTNGLTSSLAGAGGVSDYYSFTNTDSYDVWHIYQCSGLDYDFGDCANTPAAVYFYCDKCEDAATKRQYLWTEETPAQWHTIRVRWHIKRNEDSWLTVYLDGVEVYTYSHVAQYLTGEWWNEIWTGLRGLHYISAPGYSVYFDNIGASTVPISLAPTSTPTPTPTSTPTPVNTPTPTPTPTLTPTPIHGIYLNEIDVNISENVYGDTYFIEVYTGNQPFQDLGSYSLQVNDSIYTFPDLTTSYNNYLAIGKREYERRCSCKLEIAGDYDVTLYDYRMIPVDSVGVSGILTDTYALVRNPDGGDWSITDWAFSPGYSNEALLPTPTATPTATITPTPTPTPIP